MMKAWVRKDVLLSCFHRRRVAWRFRKYNRWVPCDVQQGETWRDCEGLLAVPDKVVVDLFVNQAHEVTLRVEVPSDAIKFVHRWVKPSIPLKAYPIVKLLVERMAVSD